MSSHRLSDSTADVSVLHPVFYDPSGRRWRRVKLIIMVLAAAIAAFAVMIVPQVIKPLRLNNNLVGLNTPEFLLMNESLPLPLIGSDRAALTRIVQLTRPNYTRIMMSDPITGESFGPVPPDDVPGVGIHNFAFLRTGVPQDHQLLLTFDDGPDPTYTPAILDILSRNHVPATFMVIGENAVANQDLVRREIREGHVVGNHSLTHPNFSAPSQDAYDNRLQLTLTDRLLRGITDKEIRFWRMPEGDPERHTPVVLQGQQLGYLQVDFDVDTKDWEYKHGEPVPIPDLDGKGHVVLMHDAGSNRTSTLKLLQELIDKAKAKGYTFGTVNTILPSDYKPKQIAPSLADYSLLTAWWTVFTFPEQLLTALFWFAVTSMTLVYALYLLLALRHHRSLSKRQWKPGRMAELVSVVVPAYNEQEGIVQTVDSLHKSLYPKLEVIVVNDGSTDATLQLLVSNQHRWPLLRIITQVNSGKPAALKRGVAAARGKIIVFMDGDTIFLPETISKLVRHFENPFVGAVAGNVRVAEPGKNIWKRWQGLDYICGIGFIKMAEAFMNALSIVPGACGAALKIAILCAGNLSDDTLAEDTDLTLSIQQQGWQVVQDPDAIALTDAPGSLRQLLKQRKRWYYGTMQAFYKHRRMIFNPRHGLLGMLVLPYAVMSVLVPLAFMPLALIAVTVSAVSGNWQSIAAFAIFVGGTHLLASVVAIVVLRESPWHLLTVVIYRPIYEPLKAYLMYVILYHILRGDGMRWGNLKRKGIKLDAIKDVGPELEVEPSKRQELAATP